MSVLEIYINWVNSVLGEAGAHVDGVEAVQDGKVLCELIDILAPDAGLQAKVKASGDVTPLAYITAALEHMKSHGIKIKFPAEDIVHNEIKSMLDVLWILILNYGIHHIGQNVYHRSVGNGKKNLLEWCQEELGATFDSRNTLSFNLCSGNWFVKLLEKVAGCSMEKSEDKAEHIDSLLTEIQDRYLIKKDIIKSSDIVDGTVDEHTLMIYLSLIKRRLSNSDRQSRREMYSTEGKAAAMAKIHYFEQRARSVSHDSQRSKSVDSSGDLAPVRGRSPSAGGRSSSAYSETSQLRNRRSQSLFDQGTADGETSDWSSTGSLFSGREKMSPKRGASPHLASTGDEVLHQAISEKVMEHIPEGSLSDRDVAKEMESQRISEKETDTLSEFSSSSLTKERPSLLHGAARSSQNGSSRVESVSHRSTLENGRSKVMSNGVNSPGRESPKNDIRQYQSKTSASVGDLPSPIRQEESPRIREPREENVRIRIKRPKDYIRQWEDTMDRLSGVSVTDDFGSPRSPLISNYKVEIPSRSKSFETSKSYSRNIAPKYDRTSSTTTTTQYRSRSTDLTPKITISSTSTSSRATTSIGNRNSPTQTAATRPALNSQGLESILDRLPENMRHQAQEASKFLMHTSGPEVIALIDAIKQAREGVKTTSPKESYRTPAQSDASEQTILKRRDNPEPSASGSRVRFQPTSSTATRRHQSEGAKPAGTTSTTSSFSPRVHSSSPRRRLVVSQGPTGDGEKGSDVMLSISPRSRSRSLSPRALNTPQEPELNPRSPQVQESTEANGSFRPLREELLLKNLGLNVRVIEDERPSSRLKALTSSPRANSSIESAGIMYTSSPRKPVGEIHTGYPEVTRLELGLDSDRSYRSQLDDGGLDSPPPIRRGGSGRVPRREAWEQQRLEKELSTLGSRSDTAAQSKFIEVLCKEIEVLKQKVELMEEGGTMRSSSRPSRSPSTSYSHSQLNGSYITREIRDENNQMIFSSSNLVPNSPSHVRTSSCPLLQVSSRSSVLSPRGKSPGRGYDSATAKATTSVSAATPSSSGQVYRGRTSSPGISLGYSSPARSVTPEIWGNDLKTSSNPEPVRQEKWKQLISRRNLTDPEVIELKQALACAIVENDILSAKLNNARHEIQDKLNHTNGVLDDCRRHLAKSQAENMQFRTMLEQEKQRSAAFESRIKELENGMFEVKTDNQQLEQELDQTASMLDRSMSETRPGVEVLKAENAKLISRLAKVENENDALQDSNRQLKRNQTKAMSTMDELRDCLTKVRRERQELFEEVTSLQRREQTARVQDIISNYQEKGAQDERESERALRDQLGENYFELPGRSSIFSSSHTGPGTRIRSISAHTHDRSYDSDDLTLDQGLKSLTYDKSNYSSRQGTPRRSTSQQRYYDDLSPTRYREIYPHRKSYTPRSRSCSPNRYRRARSPSPGGYFMDDSFIDQTLHEIEQDIRSERQRILNRPSIHQQRLKFSTYLSDGATSPRNRSSTGYESRLSSDWQSTTNHSSFSPRSTSLSQSFDSPAYSKAHPKRDRSAGRLNRSFSSIEDLRQKRSRSSSPPLRSPRPNADRSRSREKRVQSLKCRSPSYSRSPVRNTVNQSSTLGMLNLERAHSPRYFPRQSHSPPTRLSPNEKEKSSASKRRPLHNKSGAGEIARNLQKEFDKEDKLLSSLTKSGVFQNKSWFEMQSESDGDDTGINSSMSSRSSCERPVITRKKTPLLSDQQRRYADELIEKYTGNVAL